MKLSIPFIRRSSPEANASSGPIVPVWEIEFDIVTVRFAKVRIILSASQSVDWIIGDPNSYLDYSCVPFARV